MENPEWRVSALGCAGSPIYIGAGRCAPTRPTADENPCKEQGRAKGPPHAKAACPRRLDRLCQRPWALPPSDGEIATKNIKKYRLDKGESLNGHSVQAMKMP